MNTALTPSLAPQAAASTKPLWIAVGVLGACVIAMGATLVQVNRQSVPLAQAALPLSSAQAALTTGLASVAPQSDQVLEQKQPAGVIKPAQSAPKSGVKQTTSTQTTARNAGPVTVAQAPETSTAKPICANCGTVETVTPFTREGQGSGVGVVAGGVLGGVVGNQVGKGNGRAVATVLGAVGGGWAGNAIEKNMKKTTAYNVRVRMQDGSSRTLEQSSAPLVGSKVTVDGNVLRPA